MGFEELGKKLMRLGQDTKTGVQKMGESYQINAKISDAKKRLDQLYRAVGAQVYEANAENPLEGFEEEFAAIARTKKTLRELGHQLNQAKGVVFCPNCGAEAPKGVKFCAHCGTKLPEVENVSERMKQDAREAADEAGEIMDDMMGKAKDFMGSVAGKADAFVKGMSSKINAAKGGDAATGTEDTAAGKTKGSTDPSEETETPSEVVVERAEEAQSQTDEMTWNIEGEPSGETETEEEARNRAEEAEAPKELEEAQPGEEVQNRAEETEASKEAEEVQPEKEAWEEKSAGETGQEMGE